MDTLIQEMIKCDTENTDTYMKAWMIMYYLNYIILISPVSFSVFKRFSQISQNLMAIIIIYAIRKF